LNVHATADEPTTKRAENTNEADPRQWNQWICWRQSGDHKVPINPITGNTSWSDPDAWMTYREARAIADTRPSVDGIGFVLTDNDPFVCVDHDDVIDPDTGAVRPWSVHVVVAMDSYTEFSPSGGGLHTWGVGTKPGDRTRREQAGDSKIEVFDSGHFVTVTGDHLAGTPTTVKDRPEAIADVHDELVAGDDDGSSSAATTNADIDIDGTVNDGELDESLVHRMCAGLSDLYGRIPPHGIAADELNALLAGDYEAAYGDDGGDDDDVDRSEAELITATLLVGVAHDHTDIEPDDVPTAVAHLLTDRCRKKPFVDDGRPRKWASRGESYRTDIIQSAVEQFNPRIFELWTLKTHRTDYSYLTYLFVLKAARTLHDEAGYPTSEDIAIRATMLDLADGGDRRTVGTYKDALSRLVNHHERIQRAKIQGTNRHVYYPTHATDPPDAEYVVCGERREPEPKPPENTHT